MKPTTLFVWFLLLAFLVGLILGRVRDIEPMCEDRECPCTGTGRAVDIDCNACSVWDPIVVTGVINWGYYCGAREVVMCFETKEIEKRYDINESSCRRTLQLFNSHHSGSLRRHKE
jgi:hypothetical protein